MLYGSFAPAYAIVQKHEGGYVNNPLDTGGETYAGIARKIWPKWGGWHYIDLYKDFLQRDLKTNEKVATTFIHGTKVQELVDQFYQERWIASKAAQINSQDVANAYFDLYILSSRAVETLQLAVNKLGYNIAVDNIIGPQTIGAVNQADPGKLLQEFYKQRVDFHYRMVDSGIVSASFLPGWLNRADNFLPEIDTRTGVGILAVLGISLAGYITYKKLAS